MTVFVLFAVANFNAAVLAQSTCSCKTKESYCISRHRPFIILLPVTDLARSSGRGTKPQDFSEPGASPDL